MTNRFHSFGPRLVATGALTVVVCAAWVAEASESLQPRRGEAVSVGSKSFTESVVLGEIVAQLAGEAGATAGHRSGLGGTQVLWRALLRGDIDVYPEYTGTIVQEILADRAPDDEDELRRLLRDEFSVRISRPLGFNNTYALGMNRGTARRLGVRTVSDLREHPGLRFGFSSEFLERSDGWPSLRAAYRLPDANVRGLDHDLAYRGLESGAIDVIDLYSTDAEIRYYDLAVLQDDLNHFPAYHAVLLYRDDLARRAPHIERELLRLEGAISEQAMIGLNSRVKLDGEPERLVAAGFLEQTFGIEPTVVLETRTARLMRHTRQHLFLVAISLTAAIAVAIPLGIVAAKRPTAGQFVLGTVGILQTIPSLALFVFLIPLLGIGTKPAICALFLYSLLPIVRNTYAGLHDIPRGLHESAEALGLPAGARLRLIELPMAARAVLAGIKTAAVINVGTATLGGFIGAGGYGELIFTGIRKDSLPLILEGAVPAALMALAVQGVFELAERRLVPRGLRLKPVQ